MGTHTVILSQLLAVHPAYAAPHQRIKWTGASYVTRAWVNTRLTKGHMLICNRNLSLFYLPMFPDLVHNIPKPTIACLQLLNMALPFISNAFMWVSLTLVLCSLFSKLYQAYASPLRDVQGPWLARFTRLWYAMSSYSRKSHEIHVDLHKKYGRIVRIAPNDYSIDDLEASKIIYRSREPLVKVC